MASPKRDAMRVLQQPFSCQRQYTCKPAWLQSLCVTPCLPQDFVAQHSNPNIAYGAFHFWPVCPHSSSRGKSLNPSCLARTHQRPRSDYLSRMLPCGQRPLQHPNGLPVAQENWNTTEPRFLPLWMEGHMLAARGLKKPLVLEEFGKAEPPAPPPPPPPRVRRCFLLSLDCSS